SASCERRPPRDDAPFPTQHGTVMSSVALSAGSHGGPRLRADLAIVEQIFRGETSFVVKDPVTQKYFRFRPVEVGVMRQFDGRRTPDEIASALAEQGRRLTGRAGGGGFGCGDAPSRGSRASSHRSDSSNGRWRSERRSSSSAFGPSGGAD